MEEPAFLTVSEVLLLHGISLAEYGGADGLRDPAGFESAARQPENDYAYGHADLFGIAAAYAFHIAQAQAFIDGNKRTAIAAALAFLELNDVSTFESTDALGNAMIAIAGGELDKAGLSDLLRKLFAA
jgi:death-on-curing protein